MNIQIKRQWKDPMIIILCVLLVFLVLGSLLNGCQKKIVIGIDSAFGGDNTGYVGLMNEADFTQNVVDKLVEKLNEDSRFTVVESHDSGSSASNTERAQTLQNVDIILSIHATGNPDASKSGQKVYANVPGNENNAESLAFAQMIAKQFSSDDWSAEVGYLYYHPLGDNSYDLLDVNEDDTTVYEYETWDLMEKTSVPVVISDQIYVTNQNDIDRWANEEGYELAAEKYYQAIIEYYGTK